MQALLLLSGSEESWENYNKEENACQGLLLLKKLIIAMTNRNIAKGLLITMALAFSFGVLSGVEAISDELAGGLILLDGIAMWFFIIYGTVRLYKSEK